MSIVSVMLETPVKTGAANDRQLLGRVIGQALIAAVAFILTAVVWNTLANRLKVRPDIPEPFKTKIELFETGNYDTVFIGSSRYFHGIDPDVFDQQTAQLGIPTHSYNLGFDALDFLELQFVVRQVLADPRSHLKTMFIEPSLRVRLAPGLEHSQRALTLHDEKGSLEAFEFLIKSNHELKRKLFWTYEQASVSAVRLTNVGALTNRYMRPQEPAPDAAEMNGPMGNGYSGLKPGILLGRPVTSEGIQQMITDQSAAEQSGQARSLNGFEISQLMNLNQLAASRGVTLILLAPPTAAPEVYDEFRAVVRASQGQKLSIPMMSFADPASYPELYDPKGFTDPDHISRPISERWSTDIANHLKRKRSGTFSTKKFSNLICVMPLNPKQLIKRPRPLLFEPVEKGSGTFYAANFVNFSNSVALSERTAEKGPRPLLTRGR